MSHKVLHRSPLTPSYLRSVLDYDQHTGDFTWRVDRGGRGGLSKAGVRAGRINKGYLSIVVDRRTYAAHRLAFLWMLGRWPTDCVDHVDRRPDNNAWDNLREATVLQNGANMNPRSKKHPELPPGINRSGRKYQVGYGTNGYLGLFEYLEDALEARHIAMTTKGTYEFSPKDFP